jgi:hypothetical protein
VRQSPSVPGQRRYRGDNVEQLGSKLLARLSRRLRCGAGTRQVSRLHRHRRRYLVGQRHGLANEIVQWSAESGRRVLAGEGIEAQGKFFGRKRVGRKRLRAHQRHIESRYRGIQIPQVDHLLSE